MLHTKNLNLTKEEYRRIMPWDLTAVALGVGKEAKSIEMTPVSRIHGKDRIVINRVLKYVEPQQCHRNASLLCENYFRKDLKEYNVSFCEGYLNGIIQHCWNKLTRKKDGKVFYIDLTPLSSDENDYHLICEWSAEDIINLFEACDDYCFVPFDQFCWFEAYPTAVALFKKHYPNLITQ